jgi:hypothetical protein
MPLNRPRRPRASSIPTPLGRQNESGVRAGLRSLAHMCLLIALLGGTIHLPSAQAEVSGADHDLTTAVHSLSADHCCADVGGAAAHDEHCQHACNGGAALVPGRFGLTLGSSANVPPEPDIDAGSRCAHLDPQPPRSIPGTV